jgi:cAMP phosphodiesterase
VLADLDALLVTHAHLDHLAGFVLASPLLLGDPPPRSRALRVVALPATLEAIRAHLSMREIWFDFAGTPPGAPAVRLEAIAPGPARTATAGGFAIEAVEVAHPVPTAAYFLREPGGAVYLHAGDTGPTEALWARARPLLAGRALRAMALEVSFPTRLEGLARRTGHLTPALLLGELAKLTGTAADPAAIARALDGIPIVAIHIKGTDYDEVKRELLVLAGAGLRVVIPSQGERYRF